MMKEVVIEVEERAAERDDEIIPTRRSGLVLKHDQL
jgi:hypothetical protein